MAIVEGEGFDIAEEEEVDADAEDTVEVGVLEVLVEDADWEWAWLNEVLCCGAAELKEIIDLRRWYLSGAGATTREGWVVEWVDMAEELSWAEEVVEYERERCFENGVVFCMEERDGVEADKVEPLEAENELVE